MLNQTQSKLSILKLTATFLAILGFATISNAASPFAQNDAVNATHSIKGEKGKCGEGKCGANKKAAHAAEAAEAAEKKCGDAKAEKKCG